MHRGDYRRAGIPMLPVVYGKRTAAGWILAHTLALSLVAIAVGISAPLGLIYQATALLGGALFTASAGQLLRQPIGSHAWRHYKGSGIYLLILFVAMAADRLLPLI